MTNADRPMNENISKPNQSPRCTYCRGIGDLLRSKFPDLVGSVTGWSEVELRRGWRMEGNTKVYHCMSAFYEGN